MATADTIYEQKQCRLKDEHNLLITASEKCFLAAQKIKEQEAKIQWIRMTVGITGTLGVCAAIFTGGASLAAAGAVLLTVFMWLTSIAKGILQSREMKNFPKEWEKAKVKARRETIEQRFGAQDLREKPNLDVHGADDLKALATIYLDKDSADAVKHFLSAAASCDPQTTDRLNRLDKHQLDILFTSLTNILFADFTAFEMIIGSMALEKKDPDVVLRRVCKEIKDLAEKGYERQKQIIEQERETAHKKSSDDQSPVKNRKGAPLDLRMNHEEDFCVYSKKGGRFQLSKSDIILDIPPGAIPVEEAHIKAAVCTDFHHIHTKFQLNDDEQIVSPLVKYKMLESFEFLKPVSVSLPHLLPENFDLESVNVYHVSRNEDGTLNKRRVVDYTTSVQQDDSTNGQKIHRITIKTNTFSEFFICAICKREGEGFPVLWATVNGEFTSPEGNWRYQQFKVEAFIWDKRLIMKDFTKDIPIPPNAEFRPLNLLNYRDNTVLRVSVRKQEGQHLVPDKNGKDLTEKEKIFDLHRQLPCDECLVESKSVPMCHNWLLYTRYRDTSVTVCIDFEHIGREQQSVTSQILCHVKKDDAIPPEVVETLQGMNARQNERAAQEMGISPTQLQNLVRHLRGDGPANNDGGAQAAGSQPSASAHRRLSQDSPGVSSIRRQSERLPLGIPETREVGQTDDQEIQSPPAAAISPNRASETTHQATRLHELKFE